MIPEAESRSQRADPSRFQFTGGLLERSIYVERPADRLLPEALLSGQYCHILAPRQIGKTSICFRAARELARRGVRCAQVDVTAAGTPSTAEEWYFGLVDEIARRLRLPDPLDLWEARRGLAPAQRFRDYVRGLVEAEGCAPLVIFLDEIEMVRLSPVDVDDFLLMLRSFHEERGVSPPLRKLSFCLIGVTTPNDLIKNKSVTPFNVSKPIRVDDFTREELDALTPGLDGLDASPGALLDAVFAWTDGHPYMSMRACFELARQHRVERGAEQAAVDEVVRELFLERPLEDTNLNYAARRFEDPKFDRDGARLADKIQLYRRVLARKEPPAHNESAVQMELRICGMVKDVEVTPGKRALRPRNRVYERALDMDWLRSKGDRRFVSDAVWRWLDSGKNEAALLRGVVLEKALHWAQTNVLSEDEQTFLDASQRHETLALEQERSRITVEVVRAQSAQKEAGEELVKAQEALARATEEKAAAEEARESLAEQQAELKASMKATKRWFYLALMGLVLVGVTAAVMVQQANAKLTRSYAEADLRRDEALTTTREVNRLKEEIQNLGPLANEREQELQKKARDLEKKDDELKRKDADLSRKDDELKLKDEELRQKRADVRNINLYIARNRDLDETVTRCETARTRAEHDLQSCRTENQKLKSTQQFATPPLPKRDDDPYSP